MIVQDIISELEIAAPLAYQESYDNAGLLVGNRTDDVEKVLITLDVTEAVVREAIACGANLIVSHHPLIFRPLKSINSATEIGRCITLALQNNIAIYACHTNIDAVANGVNAMICDKIGLQNQKILSPRANCLTKLVTYVPKKHAETGQFESARDYTCRRGDWLSWLEHRLCKPGVVGSSPTFSTDAGDRPCAVL